jgi:hypothetical protein
MTLPLNVCLSLPRREVGIDSFKFDAGEANWLPAAYILSSTEVKASWPGIFSTRQVEGACPLHHLKRRLLVFSTGHLHL